MCFKHEVGISSLSGKPLKLVYQFSYFGQNISFTESDVNIHIWKAWTSCDSLSIKWKPNLSDKIRWVFFQTVSSTDTLPREDRWELQKNATGCFEQILDAAPHETIVVSPLTLISQTIQVKRTRYARHRW